MATKKVRCIDNTGVQLYLELYRVYEVRHEYSGHYRLTCSSVLMRKDRFAIIPEEPETLRRLPATNDKDDPDPEETRAWRMFRRQVPDGHCNCDIPRENCHYHKD